MHTVGSDARQLRYKIKNKELIIRFEGAFNFSNLS